MIVLTEKEIIDSNADIHQLYAGWGLLFNDIFLSLIYISTPFFTDLCMRFTPSQILLNCHAHR